MSTSVSTLTRSLIWLACLLVVAGCGTESARENARDNENRPVSDQAAAADVPTFYTDVAPIVHRHCANCHRPNQSAPFSLLTAEDIQQRASQIVEVTQSGYMPPWLSHDAEGIYAGDRRISAEQREILKRWVDGGMPLGDVSQAPPLPTWAEGWQLGTPDLVLKMEQPYELRADGPDDFRQFVVPVPIEDVKYVRAVEFRPGNKRIVHHANIVIDRTRSSRRLDAEDETVGFYGMDLEGKAEHPPGQLITWVPGRVPSPFPDDTVWKLEPGTDLILQFHMFPSGKPEQIQAEIGLYFVDKPPQSDPLIVFLMENANIDIAPGDDHFELEDELTLPVDTELLALYPHLHYLGKEVNIYTISPDGERQALLTIPDWDFNWQDVYRLETPRKLAAGTKIGFRYVFDNSADNPQNPHRPPRRVVGGNQSTDEMCHLWIQARTASDAEFDQLKVAINDHRLEQDPTSEREHVNRGIALLRSGDAAAALDYYQQMAAQDPNRLSVQMGLGFAYQALRKMPEALQHFQRAVELEPLDPEANLRLAGLLRKLARPTEALPHYRSVIQESPSQVEAHAGLALSLLDLGEMELAQQHMTQAQRLAPEDSLVLNGLGMLAKAQRNFPEADRQFRAAIAQNADDFEAHFNLGSIQVLESKLSEAQQSFETARRIRPDDADACCAVAMVQLRQGRIDEATEGFRETLNLDSQHRQALTSLAQIAVNRGKNDAAIKIYSRLIAITPTDPMSWLRRGSIKSRNRDPAGALADYRKSLELQPGFQLAHLAIADLAMAQQNWQVAKQQYEKAMIGSQVPMSAPLNFAWLLATCPDSSVRDGARAVQLAERCAKMTRFQEPLVLDRLAAAYAATGDFGKATETAEQAVQVASQRNRTEMVPQIQERLKQYRAGKTVTIDSPLP